MSALKLSVTSGPSHVDWVRTELADWTLGGAVGRSSWWLVSGSAVRCVR
jgi:hypothetical protein